jgi:hypothetical protein
MAMQAGPGHGFIGDIAASYCSAMIWRFGQLKSWQIPQ